MDYDLGRTLRPAEAAKETRPKNGPKARWPPPGARRKPTRHPSGRTRFTSANHTHETGHPMGILDSFNPLKSISVPNVGPVEPRGLVVVIGPNSSGKTQLLRDIQAQIHGEPRKLVVCEQVETVRPESLDGVIDDLVVRQLIQKRHDANQAYLGCQLPASGSSKDLRWPVPEQGVRNDFTAPPIQAENGQPKDLFLGRLDNSFSPSCSLNVV